MSTFLIATTLLFTIVAAMALGILAGYWAINAILFVFSRRSQKPEPAPALVMTQIGD